MTASLVVWAIVTVALVALGVSLDLVGHMISHLDMLLGMGLGISTGPIMMVALRRWRTKRRVNKMLKDVVRMRAEQLRIEEKAEGRKEPMSLES